MSSLREPPLRRPEAAPGSRERPWLLAWGGLAALGVANGAARQGLYADALGDHAAHQLSTVTLLLLVAAYTRWLQRRWPLGDDLSAVRVGAAWAVMTVGFELGFGHFVAGTSWKTLLADYDLLAGNLWALVPTGIALAPWVAVRLARRRRTRAG